MFAKDVDIGSHGKLVTRGAWFARYGKAASFQERGEQKMRLQERPYESWLVAASYEVCCAGCRNPQ